MIGNTSLLAWMAGIVLVAAMLMTSLRRVRILALVSGIAALGHFASLARDWQASLLVGAFVAINAVQLFGRRK